MMSRPTKHPKTGIYQFRRMIPENLRPLLGKREEKRSLGTKDPEEAKKRFAKVQAEVEAQWANLQAGSRSLSEREAHALATTIYDHWLVMFRDDPSNQLIWETDFYHLLWTGSSDATGAESGFRETVRIDELISNDMRRLCFQQADIGLKMQGLIVDEFDRFKLAKAVGAAFQRASLLLKREAQGIYSHPIELLSQPPSTALAETERSTGRSQLVSAKDGVTISGLLNAWWLEAEASGHKPSTYVNYRGTVSNLVRFLKHDDARKVTAEDILRFKDFRLTTPSAKTGKIASARTVKDTDLSALRPFLVGRFKIEKCKSISL